MISDFFVSVCPAHQKTLLHLKINNFYSFKYLQFIYVYNAEYPFF